MGREKFMRHRLLVVLLLVVISPGLGLAPVGAQAGPVNLTGTLGLHSRGSEAPRHVTCGFEKAGEKVSGTVSGVGPPPPCQVTGAVKCNKVVFGWEMAGNRGSTQPVAFKGTIESANRMTGTVG